MNVFNEAEFRDLCRRLGSEGVIRDVTVRYPTPRYFNRVRHFVRHDRRGEVVFCVIRPNGKVIMTRRDDYPAGIYRIPTGGIGYGEDVADAVFREVREELGLEVRIRAFAGVVRIRFEYRNENIMFYSYIFILDETGGRLMADASDDEISEIRKWTGGIRATGPHSAISAGNGRTGANSGMLRQRRAGLFETREYIIVELCLYL